MRLLIAALGAAGSVAFASSSISADLDGAAASPGPVRSSVNFDNLSTGGPGGAGALLTVSSQFTAQGVTFNNVSAIDYSKGSSALPGFAHSGNVAVEQCVGVEFCTAPVTVTFASAQQRVEVWVGFSSPLSQSVKVQLKALDADSAAVGTVSATLPAKPAATPIRVPLQIDAGSLKVRQIQVSVVGGFDNGLAVDDVEFTTSGPPRPCQPGAPAGSARVSTYAELRDALAACKQDIWVENSARIDLAAVADHRSGADYVLHIPAGVTLASGRSPTEDGGLLYMSRRASNPQFRGMLNLGANTHITGLRLVYSPSNTIGPTDPSRAIRIDGVDGVLVDNNEISGWPTAGVEIANAPNHSNTAGRIRISRNYIHNNFHYFYPEPQHIIAKQCDQGYGVVVGGTGYADIDRNVFDFNRHDVSGDGEPRSGYIAELNLVLTGGEECSGSYQQHFDMHGFGGPDTGYGGDAGEYTLIRRNTIRGAQSYFVVKTRPAFELRGTPKLKAIFAENAVQHHDEGSAIDVKTCPNVCLHSVDEGDLKQSGKLVVYGNRYNVDTSLELAVGDFNGDGRADVFQATGAVWAYSPSGRREWQVMNDSSLRLDSLALGDFNGDGKTDVFAQQGDQWRVSYGGTSRLLALPAGSSIPMKDYRFGDFDGDGKTDVFRANGTRFYYSSAGATRWKPLTISGFRIHDLRFGDFDGDGKTDVFSLANGHWSVSYGGATQWQRLNQQLSSNLAELVLADFNGDGRTDVARGGDDKWVVSYSGTRRWRTLNTGALAPLALMLLGDFTGDRRADALQHAALVPKVPPIISLTRFKLSGGGISKLTTWSVADMG